MRRIAVVVTVVLALALLTPAAPVWAESHQGDLGSVVFWTIRDGMSSEFQAGLKAHNAFHAKAGDTWELHTWQVISGPRAGQYMRGSFGHHWADFDRSGEMLEGDEADSAVNVDPYIAAAEPATYRHLPAISKAAGKVTALSRIIGFQVRPGQGQKFEATIGKIHAALQKIEWPAYEWWELVDGGQIPTYVVVLPRENFAGFAPGEKTLSQAVAEAYGEEAKAIWEAFGEAVKEQWVYTLAYRSDLSYVPASEE